MESQLTIDATASPGEQLIILGYSSLSAVGTVSTNSLPLPAGEGWQALRYRQPA